MVLCRPVIRTGSLSAGAVDPGCDRALVDIPRGPYEAPTIDDRVIGLKSLMCFHNMYSLTT